jgi:ribosome-associated heat shock protein Hsp15
MKCRLDKYLWCVRLTKTRSIATEEVSKGRFKLNSESVKPAREVKVGDIIQVQKNSAIFSYKVLEILDKRVGAPLVVNYLLDITPEEEIQKYKEYQAAQRVYRETDGKPTKKDRRELDRFLDDWE